MSLAAASTWWFSEFLSFGDVAVYGAVLVLLTQKHQTNVAGLVNNTLFQNHADTVPELVVLLEDCRNNRFNLVCGDVGRLEVCIAALTRSGTCVQPVLWAVAGCDGCGDPAEVLHRAHQCALCYRHGGDVAEVWGVSRHDPGDGGVLHPAWDHQGEDRRDDKHDDVCPEQRAARCVRCGCRRC